ncbi:hypothetical protein C5167_004921 [Papaver somniferum]|uniref:Uncharacterized protein n=1 Tax=Papaver somniferum TaxID=3469 RepID=A0A4Y7J8Z5_PAPSO|nr:hypothetical protein C5167_004921 [Papaver somniferum]
MQVPKLATHITCTEISILTLGHHKQNATINHNEPKVTPKELSDVSNRGSVRTNDGEEQMFLKLGFTVTSENNSNLEKQLNFNDFNSATEIKFGGCREEKIEMFVVDYAEFHAVKHIVVAIEAAEWTWWYMAASLLNVASEHTSVVAIVGKGHLRGVRKH